MPTLTLNGDTIFYQTRGQTGPRVLFLHGAGGTWKHWGVQLRDLVNTRRVAVDLPGHGRSHGDGFDTIAGYAAFVQAFLDALEWPAATIVGHSMGGAIALWSALHAPDRVGRVGLIGAGARMRVHPDILDGLQTEDILPTLRLITKWAYGPDTSASEVERAAQQMAETPASVTYGDYAACNDFDVMGELERISAPALVLTGEQDKMTPPSYAEYLAEHIPRAQLSLVPNAGHYVMIEQPRAVTDALQGILS